MKQYLTNMAEWMAYGFSMGLGVTAGEIVGIIELTKYGVKEGKRVVKEYKTKKERTVNWLNAD